MATQAFIPWRSTVNQAFATGQMNDQQMQKAMAAGTFGELQANYEETGRNADRAARNREMDIQEAGQNKQIDVGKMQTAVSGVGALGSVYLGSQIANALKPTTGVATGAGVTATGTQAVTGATFESATATGAEAGTAATTGAELGGTTSIWSTIGSYLGSAFEAIASFF